MPKGRIPPPRTGLGVTRAALQATMAAIEALERDQAAADVLGQWRAFLERADAEAPMTPAA